MPNKSSQNQILEFINESENILNNKCWIYDNFGEIYIRKSIRIIDNNNRTMIDIASIHYDPKYRGKQKFTRLLEWIESVKPWDGIYVESILNPRFAEFFLKRGYKTLESLSFLDSQTLYKLW